MKHEKQNKKIRNKLIQERLIKIIGISSAIVLIIVTLIGALI